MRFERALTFFLEQETAESQGISAMPTFKVYKNGKKVQGQFCLFYNLFFFQKIKTFGVATLDKRL